METGTVQINFGAHAIKADAGDLVGFDRKKFPTLVDNQRVNFVRKAIDRTVAEEIIPLPAHA